MADIMTIGLTGLGAAQASLNTVSHNIANVNTPDYSRQTVLQSAALPQELGNGFFGSGTQVQTVARQYSQFLQNQVFAAQTASSQLSTFSTQTDQVDSLLADANSGLSAALQDFFNQFQNLSGSASSVPVRQSLLDSAGSLTDRFHSMSENIASLRSQVNQQLTASVSNINTIAKQVANLNQQISDLAGGNNAVPNDLLDQRDKLVQDLNKEIKVSVFQQTDGTYNLYIGTGQSLVVGSNAEQLQAIPYANDAADLGVAYQTNGTPVLLSESSLQGGNLGGLFNFRSQVLDPAAKSLGNLAIEVARQFNDQNQLGVDLNGRPGANLFTSVDPLVQAAATNTGTATLGVHVPDKSSYPTSTFTLSYDGTSYKLTDTANTDPATNSTTVAFNTTVTAGAGSYPVAGGTTLGTLNGVTLMAPAGGLADATAAAAMINTAAVPGVTASATSGRLVLSSTNGQSITLTDAGGNLASIGLVAGKTASSPTTVTLDGQTLTLSLNQAMKTGDSYTITPADPMTAASTINLTMTDPAQVAAASPIAATPAANNIGSGTITSGTVTSGLPLNPNLTQPVTLTFINATQYTVSGAGIPSTATGPYTYTPEATIPSAGAGWDNGWSVSISGQPAAGDTFTVGPSNNNTVDNRNALSLAAIANNKTMGGGTATIADSYAQLVSLVGNQAHQADLSNTAQTNLLQQATQAQQSFSGVNLDEEAANLLRYQQAYQASSKVIQLAQTLFNGILAIAGQ